MSVTNTKITFEATELNCEPAALMAVDLTESGGSGFLADGVTPKLLFEPHIFWKELRKANIDPVPFASNPKYAGILYPKWGTKKYGKTSEQHGRMELAAEINRDAALKSASWGRYQILGNNWEGTGSKNLQDFVNRMYKSEDEHLDMFTAYIKYSHLDDELRGKDWAGFAAGYNGAEYRKNDYDGKLKRNYIKAKIILAAV